MKKLVNLILKRIKLHVKHDNLGVINELLYLLREINNMKGNDDE